MKNYRAWNISFDFVGSMRTILWASAIVSAISLILLAKMGLHLGSDFMGGYEFEVHFQKPVSESSIRRALSPLGLEDARVQRFGSATENSYLILTSGLQKEGLIAHEKPQAVADKIEHALQDYLQLPATQEHLVVRSDFVGPQVGTQQRNQGIWAVVLTLVYILIYIAVRFDFFFGPGAIVATLHDIVVILGVFALFQVEFNLTVVGALLTLIGFSLNDTIVVYDRIRENLRRFPQEPLRALVNRSINETLSRTVLTSTTVLMVVTALFLGGPYMFGFALTMFVGVIVGTYSSIAVASPVYILLYEYFSKASAAAREQKVL